MAIWRRLKLTARGDPDHDHVVAQIVARLTGPPRRAVVLAGDETHLNLLPHVRVSWTLSFGSPFSSTARQPRPQKGPADREPGATPGSQHARYRISCRTKIIYQGRTQLTALFAESGLTRLPGLSGMTSANSAAWLMAMGANRVRASRSLMHSKLC